MMEQCCLAFLCTVISLAVTNMTMQTDNCYIHLIWQTLAIESTTAKPIIY